METNYLSSWTMICRLNVSQKTLNSYIGFHIVQKRKTNANPLKNWTLFIFIFHIAAKLDSRKAKLAKKSIVSYLFWVNWTWLLLLDLQNSNESSYYHRKFCTTRHISKRIESENLAFFSILPSVLPVHCQSVTGTTVGGIPLLLHPYIWQRDRKFLDTVVIAKFRTRNELNNFWAGCSSTRDCKYKKSAAYNHALT